MRQINIQDLAWTIEDKMARDKSSGGGRGSFERERRTTSTTSTLLHTTKTTMYNIKAQQHPKEKFAR